MCVCAVRGVVSPRSRLSAATRPPGDPRPATRDDTRDPTRRVAIGTAHGTRARPGAAPSAARGPETGEAATREPRVPRPARGKKTYWDLYTQYTPAGRAHLWLPECGPFLGPFLTKCLLISASVPRLESSMCAPRTAPRLATLAHPRHLLGFSRNRCCAY